MMGNAIHAIRAYVGDMLAAYQSVLGPIGEQLRSADTESIDGARGLLEKLHRVLSAHVEELAVHLRRIGGQPSNAADAPENLATNLLDAAAAKIAHKRPIGAALRDDYTALSLAHAGALMLETNARALSFSSTAALAARHREELETLLRAIQEILPKAVRGEVDAQSQTLDVAM